MRRRTAIKLLLAVVWLAAGCSTGPQVLPVTPSVAVGAESPLGAGRTLTIEVYDARESPIVGYRDPEDPASVITASPDMLRNIRQRLESAYAALGFAVVEPGDDADVVMQVNLTEFAYQRALDGVVKDLKTGVTIVVSSTMRDRTVKGTYRDAQGKDTVVQPTRAKNAEILNAHLNATLSKLVEDRRLVMDDW